MTPRKIHCLWPLLATTAVLFSAACGSDDAEGTVEPGSDAGANLDSTSSEGTVEETGTAQCDPPGNDLDWVSIPAGSFSMGCSAGDDACLAAESPSHTVNVSAFELTATEITQAQYLAQTGENNSKFDDCPTCPVDSVKWSEANDYCVAVGGRLPTEAEWEYAARAAGSDSYACGASSACLADIAWYDQNAVSSTHAVASKNPTGHCLYDMAGNVWEWVQDCWHDTYDGAPEDGSAWVAGDCTYRIQRGGAFGVGASELRVSSRGGDYPDMYFVPAPGFRCARSPQ